MGVQEVVVEDLFGEFAHKIEFNSDEGLTLIHGPNGVGKTTVLRLVDALFSHRFSALGRVPFGALHVSLTGGDRLQVTRRATRSAERPRPPVTLEFILVPANARSESWTYRPKAQAEDFPLGLIEEYIPELSRVAQREWLETTTGETLDLDEVYERFLDRLPPLRKRADREIPNWLSEFLAQVPVYFIEAQRLSSSQGLRSSRARRSSRLDAQLLLPTVVVFAEDLAEKIRRTLAGYGDHSQALDSTFPSRLLQTESPRLPSEGEVRARYSDQAERRNRYVRAGLLDSGDVLTLPERELNSGELRVLSAYLDDVDSKLEKLNDLADKLDLFLSIVNGKFRRKAVAVDREKGLRVVTSDNAQLDLAGLSSGEQQEVVLAYGLLFRETPGTLILLDEPELSLHVSWQLDLIPDLLKIAELTKLEFLVATHSPQIINDRWDLTVELGN